MNTKVSKSVKLHSKGSSTEGDSPNIDLVHRINAKTSFSILSEQYSELSAYEEDEILLYEQIYYFGQGSAKISGGYSDEQGNYIVVIGDHIAYRYEIVSINGRGAFGEVLECIDRKTMCKVAIKVLNKKPMYLRSGKKEAKSLEKLEEIDDFQVLLQKIDAFEFRGHFFIVFEYLHENLFQYIEKRHFVGIGLVGVKMVAKQVLENLRLLHSIGGIHCDLKPENIMLKKEGLKCVKVIDYGSACFRGEKMLDYVQSRYYRAPEIVLGSEYCEKIDMWSVGCLLFECFTGQVLFPAESEAELLAMIQVAIGPPPRKLVGDARFKENYFNSTGQLRSFEIDEAFCRRIENCAEPKFESFLRLFLKWNPEERISAEKALFNPWLLQ